MTTRRFGDLCLPDSGLHRPLQDQCVDVMPPDAARPGVPRRLRGRTDILLYPPATGIGIFPLQCIRQVHMPSPRLQSLYMERVDVVELLPYGPLTCWGSMVTRSLRPLPSRTTI